jgi:hypothetical protein
MQIAENTPSISSSSAVQRYDGWIVLGYAVCVLIAIAAIYLAASGPGATETNLAIATIMP